MYDNFVYNTPNLSNYDQTYVCCLTDLAPGLPSSDALIVGATLEAWKDRSSDPLLPAEKPWVVLGLNSMMHVTVVAIWLVVGPPL